MSNLINQLLMVPYVESGRTLEGLDCWGLVRYVLHHQYNKPLLASFGNIKSMDYRAMTNRGYSVLEPFFAECSAKNGAVACCFSNAVFLHVGICVAVDSKLKVLHTSKKTGPVLHDLDQFEHYAHCVRYFEYDNN